MRRVLLSVAVFLCSVAAAQSQNGIPSTPVGVHAKRFTANAEVLLAITSYSPGFGPPGTVVTVRGTGFGPPSSSSYLSVLSPVAGSWITWTPTSWSDTEIVVSVPSTMRNGLVYLNVTVSGLQSIGVSPFTIGTPPIVGNYSPEFGPSGTVVTIHGAGFGLTRGSSSVSIQSAMTNDWTTWLPTNWSDTEIVVSVPRFVLSGKVYLSVTVGGLQSIGVYPFTVGTPPVITAYSPQFGPSGKVVTIRGTGFGSTQGSSSVSIQSAVTGVWTTWAPTSWNDTEIVASVPATMPHGLVYLNLTVNGLQSIGVCPFTVGTPPVITAYSPEFGSPGAEVTIRGTGFGSMQGSSYIAVHSAVTSVWTTWAPTSWSDTEIVASVPNKMPLGKVYLFVEVDELQSLSWHPFTVGVPALITGYSPASGSSGTVLTIHGSGFGSTQGSSSVSIQPALTDASFTWAPTSWSDGEITVSVPRSVPSGKVYLSVTVGGLQTIGVYPFTVGTPPVVNAYSPQFGPPETVVTIHGTGFGSTQGNSSISIQSAATDVWTTWAPTSWSDTEIAVPVPSSAPSGKFYLSVTAGGLESIGVYPFTVGTPPVVAAYSPQFGPSETVVTIHGTGFGSTQGNSSVSIQPAVTNVWTTWASKSWSDSEIAVPVPTSVPSGEVYLSVTVGGLQSIGVYPFTVGTP
jgi:IPT/TIG domain